MRRARVFWAEARRRADAIMLPTDPDASSSAEAEIEQKLALILCIRNFDGELLAHAERLGKRRMLPAGQMAESIYYYLQGTGAFEDVMTRMIVAAGKRLQKAEQESQR